MTKIRRALISVSDKSGLLPFVQQLSAAGVEMISTGGTARAIREAGFEVIELSDYTGFPEMLDGRVKTLHPKVHGGLLYLRDNPEHCDTVKEHAINPIDLVVVNLYPFEATIAKPDVTLEEAIENIDIGGPSMLRSAAKNHQSVTVVVDPADYQQVGEAIAQDGATSLALRRSLAARVYAHTAAYDAAIANHLQQAFDQLSEDEGAASATPGRVLIHAAKAQELRYGENP
ncbi:MAG: bifunctional phosphoribosylaminoimidazolecarboxamide formyltransferase/IMP cyclohydrolase, partial [Limisphaerales bacterium]